jgi:drug/metabolite transporter (DMT)-like permease
MTTASRRTLGILCGIGAGMLWGLDFLPAQILKDYSPIEFAFGRYFFLGAASLFFAKSAIKTFLRFSPRDRLQALLLSASGFWLYYMILFWSIKYGSPVITTLVVGAMPATIALASKDIRSLGKQFIGGLLLILGGLVTLNLSSLGDIRAHGFLAWALPFGGLALWTWYGVNNSIFVKRHPDMSKTDLVSIMGLITCAVITLAGALTVDILQLFHHEHSGLYVLLAAVLGIGSSWLGFWLWNICALHCPSSISGPLLVTETMFGLLYTFIYQGRMPVPAEAASIALFCAGALMVIHAETKLEN